MTQIPNINVGALDQYDRALSDPNSQKAGDKRKKDKFKKLIAGALGVMLCSATREQCLIREMPAAGCSLVERSSADSAKRRSAAGPCLPRWGKCAAAQHGRCRLAGCV